MSLNKVNYVDGVTVITAQNMNDIQEAIISLQETPQQGLTDAMKQALLQLAQKVAYIDDQGQTYYQDLYDAFYPPADLVSITAVYTQSGTVYPTTPLADLKADLVVTGTYDDQSTATIPASDYSLSGTLTVGTSTITVTSGGKTTTFSVTVTAAPTLSSISVVYTQSGTVYDTDSLDSLKADLVVTAVYSDSSTQTVPAADYTLSGTLTAGTSTITVSYGGKTATFDVTVEHYSEPVTVYFADLTWEDTTMKKDGTLSTISRGHHLEIPYHEGMEINTFQNTSWVANYPPFVLRYSNSYHVPTYETVSTSRYKVTLSGLPTDTQVFVNWYGATASITTPPRESCYYVYTP